jgi:hypothetical protein
MDGIGAGMVGIGEISTPGRSKGSIQPWSRVWRQANTTRSLAQQNRTALFG